ncbi:hypothetical protein C9975_04380, partial [Thalassospira xiamenensis]
MRTAPPVILDLSNDDFQLIDLSESSAFFDYDGDGYLENIGWIAGDDGILSIDLNGSDTIDDVSEFVFANETEAKDTDLEALATLYDSNGDGVLNAEDERWADFRVWQDWNGDGQSQEGEVSTLAELNITEIGLVSNGIEEEVEGNTILGRASFTRQDGTTGDVGDVSFKASSYGYRQTEDGIEIGDGNTLVVEGDDGQARDLADSEYDGLITGAGDDTLSNSAGKDGYLSAGAGKDTLIGGDGDEWLSGGEGADTIIAGAGHDVLFVDALDSIDGGEGFDVVLGQGEGNLSVDLGATNTEAVYGAEGSDDLRAGNAQHVMIDGGAGDDRIIGGSGNDLLSGGEGADILRGGAGDDTLIVDENDDFNGGAGQDRVIFMGDANLDINITDYEVEVFNSGGGDDIIRTDQTHEAAIDGGEGNDTIFGGWGDDWLGGGHGADTLKGGYGDDTYIFRRGDGLDTIHDYSHNKRTDTLYDLYSDGSKRNVRTRVVDVHENAGNDRIVFGQDIRPEDIVLGREGGNLIIGIRDGADDNRSISQLSDRIVVQNGFDPRDAVEGLVFADGSVARINLHTLDVEYSVLRADASNGEDLQADADPISVIGNAAGYGVGEPLDDIPDGETIRDKRSQRQNALSSSQSQSAQAAEVMLLASLGVAAGAAVNPALAGGDEASDNFASLLPQDSGSDVSPDSGQTLDVYPEDAGSVNEHEENPNQEVLPQDQQGEQPEASGSYDNGSAVSSDPDFSLDDDGLQDQVGDVAVDLTESQDAESPVLNNLQEQENASDPADAMLAEEQRRLAAVIGTGGDDVLFADFNTQYQQVDGQGGHDTLVMRIPANQPFDAGAHNIEVVVGSVASDYLRTSSAENVTFYGNGGNDTLLGGSGNDILAGGAGADRLSGGNGRDTAFYGAALGGVSVDLMAGTGTDGEAAGDILESIENVIGSSFADTILGNGVSNDITGGAGNDYVDAAAGDDIVRGGAGVDTLIGGAGIDALDYTSSTEAVQIDLAAGTGLGGDAEGDVVSQFEIVLGSHGSDVLSGDAGNELLDGGEGDDLLHGRDGNDDLIGGVGNDTLIGGLGADNLDGGDGFDWASYADAAEGVAVRLDLGKGTGSEALGDLYSGIEAVAGSAFADTIIGDGNANHIRGGAGSDRLDGGSGNDILSGGDGDDVIVGGIGADTID